jgi:RHS repeat-associated protein
MFYQTSSSRFSSLPPKYTESYRYQFMGYEGDPEIKGEGNSYTTEFRQYDPRVGRWLTVDPVVKYNESPYASFANNPIWFIDPNGADSSKIGDTWYWEVKAGDTWSSISGRTGVSASDLAGINDLGTGELQEGQYLSFSVKTHFVYQSLTPTIYTTTVQGLELNPAWSQLTYNGPNSPITTANRKAAVLNCTECISGVTTRDEFPYASTAEGGGKSVCNCTPKLEQSIQGGQLWGLYRNMKAGDTFNVVPVPIGGGQKVPQEVPNPIKVPVYDPVPVVPFVPYFTPRAVPGVVPSYNPMWWVPLILPVPEIVPGYESNNPNWA